MNLEKAEEMMKLMRAYGVTELKISEGDSSIKISTGMPQASFQAIQPGPMMHTPTPVHSGFSNAAPSSPASTAEQKTTAVRTGFEVKSPFVGTFYASSAPGEEPFVKIGTRVSKGDTLCIVEAMKLMNEIEAEKDGVISEILIDNEQPVEFDQVLFVID